MRICTGLLISAVLLATVSTAAKEKTVTPPYKTAEAKHFTQAEGVELTPSFEDYFYAELRAQLKKANMASDVIGEGESVDDADAARSIVITGTITEYKKGSVVKNALIGFGAGLRSLKMDADVKRRSDNENLYVLHVHVKIDPKWDEKVMAKFAADQLVKEMKNEVKTQGK